MRNKTFLFATAAWVMTLFAAPNIRAQSPTIFWKRQVNSDRINTVIFNPSGDTLIAGSSDRLIQFWRVSDGTLLKTLNTGAAYVHESAIESLTITSDGTKLASASFQVVKLWTLPSGAEQDLYGHNDWVVGVAFSPNGQYLASASFDQSVKIWRPSDGALLRTIVPSTQRQMRTVAFSPDSTLLAAAGGDDLIHVWRTSDWTEVRTLTGHTDDIYTITFSPDGTKIASGGYDQTARIWDVATGALLHTFAGNGGNVYGVAFTPDNSKLAYADGEGSTIRIHRVSDGVRLQLYNQETYQVQTVAFSAAGLLGYGRADKTVVLAGISTNTPPPPAQTYWVLSTSVSGSGSVTVSPAPTGPNGTYTNGTVVQVTATPNVDNHFVNWQGSSTSPNSTISLTMNGNKSLTALFAENVPAPTTATQIIWHTGDNRIAVWGMDGANFTGQYYLYRSNTVASGWRPIGVSDFNGDGEADLLFISVNRTLALNYLRSDTVVGWAPIGGGQKITTGWDVVGVGDFNRDGHPDIVFESTDGRSAVWFLNDAKVVANTLVRNGFAAGSNWKIQGIGDLNYDGYPDLIWRNGGGVCTIWFMRSTSLASWSYLRGGSSIGSWNIVGVGDLTRDGSNDILLRDDNGKNNMWQMEGATYERTALMKSADPTWRVVGFR